MQIREIHFCEVCGSPYVELHHVVYRSENKNLENCKLNFVYLCQEHHRGTYGVHGKYGHDLDLKLKQECQKEYEKNHTREEFIKLIGKSYL